MRWMKASVLAGIAAVVTASAAGAGHAIPDERVRIDDAAAKDEVRLVVSVPTGHVVLMPHTLEFDEQRGGHPRLRTLMIGAVSPADRWVAQVRDAVGGMPAGLVISAVRAHSWGGVRDVVHVSGELEQIRMPLWMDDETLLFVARDAEGEAIFRVRGVAAAAEEGEHTWSPPHRLRAIKGDAAHALTVGGSRMAWAERVSVEGKIVKYHVYAALPDMSEAPRTIERDAMLGTLAIDRTGRWLAQSAVGSIALIDLDAIMRGEDAPARTIPMSALHERMRGDVASIMVWHPDRPLLAVRAKFAGGRTAGTVLTGDTRIAVIDLTDPDAPVVRITDLGQSPREITWWRP